MPELQPFDVPLPELDFDIAELWADNELAAVPWVEIAIEWPPAIVLDLPEVVLDLPEWGQIDAIPSMGELP